METFVRIFGSAARGDQDIDSDLDILVVADDVSEIKIEKIKSDFPAQAEFSIYSTARLQTMFSEGHLFAWHIFLESVVHPVNQREDWNEIFSKPNPYKDALVDISNFLLLAEDCRNSILNGSDVVFEAGILHLVLRNLGMILQYEKTGVADFSRFSAMRIDGDFKNPLSNYQHDLLLSCRRFSKRGILHITPEIDEIRLILDTLQPWFNLVRRKYGI